MSQVPSTDVSTAQTFDVGSFLNNLVNVGAAVVTARTQPTQNTGQPAATTQPNVRANPAGNTAPVANNAISPSYLWLGLGIAGAVALVLVLRSK